jgi:hypothetical protein
LTRIKPTRLWRFTQEYRELVLEADTLHFQAKKKNFINGNTPALHLIDALIEFFVLLGEASEMSVTGQQSVQLRNELRKLAVQRVMFQGHNGILMTGLRRA